MTFATFLLLFAGILLASKIAGIFCERLNIPAVVGELLAGIAIGNLGLIGVESNFLTQLKTSELFHNLSEIGVILLLFLVGLESNLQRFINAGKPALIVACTGVIAPFLFIFGGWYLMPFDHGNLNQQIFLAATATATSVGITARVLKDLGRVASTEGQVILGAAVIDDVLGLLILAVVSALVEHGSVDMAGIAWITAKAVLFLGGMAFVGRLLLPRFIFVSGQFDSGGLMGAIAFATCFGCAYLADLVGLAPIVGAFTAGLILDDVHFQKYHDARTYSLEQLVKPVADLFVPVFFVLMGINVSLATFASPTIIGGALVLTALAVAGKICAGIFLKRGSMDKLAIGLGMIPRGEVGLIFASIGASLNVVNASEYAMIVFMVIATTLITPSLLQWRFRN
jgi:Kef-type K+ transport system membrane component KefB